MTLLTPLSDRTAAIPPQRQLFGGSVAKSSRLWRWTTARHSPVISVLPKNSREVSTTVTRMHHGSARAARTAIGSLGGVSHAVLISRRSLPWKSSESNIYSTTDPARYSDMLRNGRSTQAGQHSRTVGTLELNLRSQRNEGHCAGT